MKRLAAAAFVMAALIAPAFAVRASQPDHAAASSGAVCKPAQGTDVSKADYPIGFTGLGMKNTSSGVLPIVCPLVTDNYLNTNYLTLVAWTANNPSDRIVCALKSLSQDGTVVRQSNFGSRTGSGYFNMPQSGINGLFNSLDCQLPPGGTLNTIWVNYIQ